jgi:hypothetical protein
VIMRRAWMHCNLRTSIQRELNQPTSIARLVVAVHDRGVDHERVSPCAKLASSCLRSVHARLRDRHFHRSVHVFIIVTKPPFLHQVPVAFVDVPETMQSRLRALHRAQQTLSPCVLLLARNQIEAPGRRTVGHHDVDVLWNICFPKMVLRARVAECPLAAFGLVGGGEDRKGRAVLEGEGMRAFGQVRDAGVFCQRPGHDRDGLIVLLG